MPYDETDEYFHRVKDRAPRPQKKRKTCACCGSYAGKWEQWFNQDTGFGLCSECVTWIKTRRPFGQEPMTTEEFERIYGLAGAHYEEATP